MSVTGTVALVTCEALPNLTEDEQMLVPALEALGLRVRCWSWTAPVDWSEPDLVVIRTTWDYVHQREAFVAWAERLTTAGVRLHNPLPLVRWNLHKSYLRDLEAAGVPVVPTRWVARGERADLGAILRERGWERFVIKPAVGATASGAFRGGPDTMEAGQAHLDELARHDEVLVQPFVEAICDQGEISVVFAAGCFSHALVKVPAAGDWRSQEEWGGSVDPIVPDAATLAAAERAMAAVPGETLYGRVDLVALPGGLGVVEVEVVEPALYFRTDPAAPARFAALIAALTTRG